MSDKPSWSETPNIVFELMPHLSGAQFKILMLICRKTYGYHEETARISYSEFMEATGLTKQSIIDALNWFADAKIIKWKSVGNSFAYSFDHNGTVLFLKNGQEIRPVDDEQSGNDTETVNKLDQIGLKILPSGDREETGWSKNHTRNGKKIRPEMVRKLDRFTPTQTKKQKTKLLSSNEESARAPKKAKDKDPPEVLERRRALKTAWVQESGAENYNPVQVNAGIAQLERAGCMPEEIVACHAWMKEDSFWAIKTIYPQSIFKKLDEYRRWLQRKANTYGSGNGKRPVPDGYVDLSTYESKFAAPVVKH